MEVGLKELRIDREFKELIPRQSDAEYESAQREHRQKWMYGSDSCLEGL